MNQVLQMHASLLQSRTSIRNNASILLWMRRCWSWTARARPTRMSRSEYDAFYSSLLQRMLVEWSDRCGAAVLDTMWEHDACSFDDLDGDRFSCSIFFFVEMWVNAITVEEYTRIFAHIHRILLSKDDARPAPSSTTLSAFLDALTTQLDMERDNASIGRSIIFDAERFYYRSGGLPPLFLDTAVVQPKRSLRSAPGTRRTSDSSLGSSTRRRLSLASLEVSDAALQQLRATPKLSRAVVQARSSGSFNVTVVPKRLELLSRRNRRCCFRLDASGM